MLISISNRMEQTVERFLTTIEEQEIVAAIREAELNTSGEIRVHLEDHCKGKINERALEVFKTLHMDNTRQRNGLLIYVAVFDKTFGIYGDEGINKLVPNNFWNSTKDVIQSHFKKGHFKQGLVDGVLLAGVQLKKHFPFNPEDLNELPNTISKG